MRPDCENEACGECGNFTLVRIGACPKCDTCGSTTGAREPVSGAAYAAPFFVLNYNLQQRMITEQPY